MSGVFHLPEWAGTPPKGPVLEVIKDDVVKYKRRIDRKPYYLFGRRTDSVDIPTEHGSCSRIHAALVYDAQREHYVLMDLESSNGTFIGESKAQLKPHEPAVIPFGAVFRFGASTRSYVIKENVKTPVGSPVDCVENRLKTLDIDKATQSPGSILVCTPESTVGANERKRKRPDYTKAVSFDLAEEIITVDEMDWSFRSYRNFGSSKRRKLDGSPSSYTSSHSSYVSEIDDGQSSPPKLFENDRPGSNGGSPLFLPSFFEKLQIPPPSPMKKGSRMGNDMESYESQVGATPPVVLDRDDGFFIPHLYSEEEELTFELDGEPKKKKYPKEVWPRGNKCTYSQSQL